jgi:hypothetical protein
MKDDVKQNVTIRLDRGIAEKAKILARRLGMSVSELLTRQIEILVGEEEAYERAKRQALALMDEGFHLGVGRPMDRNGVHERANDTNLPNPAGKRGG